MLSFNGNITLTASDSSSLLTNMAKYFQTGSNFVIETKAKCFRKIFLPVYESLKSL